MTHQGAAVVGRLRATGATLAVAESLTAGLVSDAIARVPGASAVLRGGVIAYAADLKTAVLGVDAGLLAGGGPVQAVVAEQMVAGVCALLGAGVGVATTGVAGPGPAEGRAPGTAYVAAGGPGGAQPVRVRRLQLAGTRQQVREATTRAALALLRSVLEDGATAGEQPRDRAGCHQ